MSPRDAQRQAKKTGKSLVYIDGRGRKRVALAGPDAPIVPRDRAAEHDRETQELIRDLTSHVEADALYARRGRRQSLSRDTLERCSR